MTPVAPQDLDFDEPPESAPDRYAVNYRDLPEEMVNAFRAHLSSRRAEERFSRRREVIRDRTNRFYERGYQHIYWNDTRGTFSIASPGGVVQNSAGQSVQCPHYIDDYNIFFPYLRIIMSQLTQNPPGVNFQPLDPKNPEDIDKAELAEQYARLFDRQNDRPMLQASMVRMMGLSGRTVAWTRTERDERDGEPFQITTIHGTLETKVPLTAKDLAGCGYLFIDDDPDLYRAKTDYPWIRDRIQAGQPTPGENAYERTARLGVLSGTRSQIQIGDSFTHLASRTNVFLRPREFASPHFDDVRDEVESLFPDGVRLVFLGDTYACAHPERMDDHIDIQFPYDGDGMFRQAFMDSMLVVQDAFNDVMNGAREHYDTGWGELWIDAEDEEYAAITSQESGPNVVRQKKLRAGQSMQQAIESVPMQNLPGTFVQYLELLQAALPQFQLAAPPAIFGASMEDQKTASGYAQARAQALGQLGIIWARIQRMFARIRYQSVLAAAACDQMRDLTLSGAEGQSILIEMNRFRKGDFGCYPDEDSSFPETTNQKRATLNQLVTMAAQNPFMLSLVNNPDNIEELKRLNGFDELTLIPAEARDKQLYEIEQLLHAEPFSGSPQELDQAQILHAAQVIQARAQRLPEPPPFDPQSLMHSSVPIDELDYHQFEFEKCQEWLSSAARRTEDSRGNQKGVLNVKLHALEHRNAIQAAMTPPPSLPPPPVPGAAHSPRAKPAPAMLPSPPAPPPAPAAPGAASLG